MNNRRLVLAERPVGRVNASTTRLETVDRPTCGDNEALVKIGMLSIDPTIRTWMDDAAGYLPPIQIGDVIRSGGAGVVVETNSTRYQVGDVVYGMSGWQEYCIASEENRFTVLPTGMGIDLATVMNVVGLTGLTAYFGVTDVGAITEGDVVVISGAAGATGSVAGQIAKARGAKKVVGIAGGPDKCREVVELYGFDECLDYKEPQLARRLHEACPNGVNLYFDNVGGAILDDVLGTLAMRARVVLCGAIAQYNATEVGPGLQNYLMLLIRRARMEGFIILDYADRFSEAQMELATMLLSGKLAHREHLVPGLEHAPDALNLLFSGGNHGKTLVVVDDSVTLR
jgi:NADPH-dependent curcumin reductase CurA